MDCRFFLYEIRFSFKKDYQRILLVTDYLCPGGEGQYDLIIEHRKALRKKYKILVSRVLLKRAMKFNASKLSKYNYIGLKLFCLKSSEEYLSTVKYFHKLKKTSTKLVGFDGDDDLTIVFPESLYYYDIYLKRQIFSEKANYLKKYIGKNNLTDYLVSKDLFNLSLLDAKECLPVEKEFLSKINYSWNIGIEDKIYSLIPSNLEPEKKTIDIVCRALSDNKSDWREPFRKPAIEKINLLKNTFTVLASSKRVSNLEYRKELSLSKICVSPYGYGEVCWRDFEAILFGCLLVKPDMSHINTWPNVYIKNQTYVSIERDFSNLEEVCKYYLTKPDERLRITKNAKEVLLESFKSESFTQKFIEVLFQ